MCLPPREEVAKTTTTSKATATNTTNHQRRRYSRPSLPLRRRVEIVQEDDCVTFHEEDQIHQVPTTLLCLEDDQDRNQLWYNRDDIKEFRRQAQVLSKKCLNAQEEEEEEHECTRGLELRMSHQRQDRKQRIVKRILDAQDDDCTAEELSQISLQYSAWSRKLAAAQGHKDFYSVYHPNLTCVLPELPALLDCSRDLTSHKRSLLGSSLDRKSARNAACFLSSAVCFCKSSAVA